MTISAQSLRNSRSTNNSIYSGIASPKIVLSIYNPNQLIQSVVPSELFQRHCSPGAWLREIFLRQSGWPKLTRRSSQHLSCRRHEFRSPYIPKSHLHSCSKSGQLLGLLRCLQQRQSGWISQRRMGHHPGRSSPVHGHCRAFGYTVQVEHKD